MERKTLTLAFNALNLKVHLVGFFLQLISGAQYHVLNIIII